MIFFQVVFTSASNDHWFSRKCIYVATKFCATGTPNGFPILLHCDLVRLIWRLANRIIVHINYAWHVSWSVLKYSNETSITSSHIHSPKPQAAWGDNLESIDEFQLIHRCVRREGRRSTFPRICALQIFIITACCKLFFCGYRDAYAYFRIICSPGTALPLKWAAL